MPIITHERDQGVHNLRKGRYSQPHRIYHITAVTLGRRQWFRNFRLGRLVVGALRREEAVGNATTLAYVIMPDHFHWLMSLADNHALSTTVGNAKSLAAKQVNDSIIRAGPIWQRGFHDRAIRREEDLASVARYIIANPLRAGLVDTMGEYPLWDAVWL